MRTAAASCLEVHTNHSRHAQNLGPSHPVQSEMAIGMGGNQSLGSLSTRSGTDITCARKLYSDSLAPVALNMLLACAIFGVATEIKSIQMVAISMISPFPPDQTTVPGVDIHLWLSAPNVIIVKLPELSDVRSGAVWI